MADQNKFHTFAVTIRPRDGITDKQIETFVLWCKKQCLYYHVITEKTDYERHVHAAVFFNLKKTRSNVCTMMKRLYKDLSSEEQKVLLRGIKVMYNKDFVMNYMNKDDDTVIIESVLPESNHMESYFPPPKPAVSSDGRTKKCSAYYHELERLWYEHMEPHHEKNTMVIRDFLFKMMYSLRVIPVMRDDNTIRQTARHLCRWLNKSESCPTDFLPPFEKEEN